jgi:hypothetical protein
MAEIRNMVPMDSLKVTGASFISITTLVADVVPWLLMVAIGILNIVYLVYKIKKIKG